MHGLLRAPTLTLGDTQKVTSTDSLELQRGTSGDTMDYAALQTPQAKRMAVSPSPYVLVPDANQSPTPGSVNPSSEKVYELDENGWTFVLQSWCKNNPGYQAAFWAKGVDGNVFTFSEGGKLSPEPLGSSFPLVIFRGSPPSRPSPHRLELNSPTVPALVEPSSMESTIPATLDSPMVPPAEAPSPPETVDSPKPAAGESANSVLPAAPAHEKQSGGSGGAGTVVGKTTSRSEAAGASMSPPDAPADNMYTDGTYWKILGLNLWFWHFNSYLVVSWSSVVGSKSRVTFTYHEITHDMTPPRMKRWMTQCEKKKVKANPEITQLWGTDAGRTLYDLSW